MALGELESFPLIQKFELSLKPKSMTGTFNECYRKMGLPEQMRMQIA